jgi:hypothetical protein
MQPTGSYVEEAEGQGVSHVDRAEAPRSPLTLLLLFCLFKCFGTVFLVGGDVAFFTTANTNLCIFDVV